MTLYAGTQQAVFYPNVGMPGDQYGLQTSWLPSQGYVAASNVNVASGVFGVVGTDTVQQSGGSGTIFAGFVLRSQEVTIPYAQTNLGYGFYVPATYQCSVLPKGSLWVVVATSYHAGSVINVGDAVFVSTVDGTVAVGVTSEPDYYQTDFVVTNTDQSNINQTNQVVISNVNQFLGQGR